MEDQQAICIAFGGLLGHSLGKEEPAFHPHGVEILASAILGIVSTACSESGRVARTDWDRGNVGPNVVLLRSKRNRGVEGSAAGAFNWVEVVAGPERPIDLQSGQEKTCTRCVFATVSYI